MLQSITDVPDALCEWICLIGLQSGESSQLSEKQEEDLVMFQQIAAEFIRVRAERKFKEAVSEITQAFTADYLLKLAERGITLSAILKECGYDLKPPENLHPAAQYLLELPDHRILELIREAAPGHGEVLEQYPEFAAGVIRAFRELVVTR